MTTESDPPVSPEEEVTMDRLAQQTAEAVVRFHVEVMTPLYVLAHGIFAPFTREPARWPFRLGVMPEDDRV